jgi:uncharacterized protein
LKSDLSQQQTLRTMQHRLADVVFWTEPDQIAALFSAAVQFEVPGDVGVLPWIGNRSGRTAASDFIRRTRLLLERVTFDVRES